MNKDEVNKINFMIIKKMIMSNKGRHNIIRQIGGDVFKKYIKYFIDEKIIRGSDLDKLNKDIREDSEYRQGKTEAFKNTIQEGFHLLCDGGTTSNNPKDYGDAYGSFMYFIDSISFGAYKRSFGKGSVNYAEIKTVTHALRFIGHLIKSGSVPIPMDRTITIHCDSQISVKWITMFIEDPHCDIKASKGSSQLFIDALHELQETIRNFPRLELTASWVPREVCVEYLGH